jgi:hypothetical protein
MKTLRRFQGSPATFVVMLISVAFNLPLYAGAQDERARLVADAVSSDASVADPAIARLRARGLEGLRLLLTTYRTQLAALGTNPAAAADPLTSRVRAAVDRVAAQRDAFASGLYWYTDLEEAKREAVRLNRPILSLRLLGRLDEEYSCANSRLFRTTLYPNERVAARLRDSFVLHWSTERPAPLVRIDMGDGRSITRTITGNSVHYVLNARGVPIDALPGLYGPTTFVAQLDEATAAARRCSVAHDGEQECIRAWHQAQAATQAVRWASFQQLNRALAAYDLDVSSPRVAGVPSATIAMRLTVSKMAMEQPVLQAVGAPSAPSRDARWDLVAQLIDVGQLDARSLSVIRLKLNGEAFDQARLQANIALDTARNEFEFHRRIHRMFETAQSFTSLNMEIYSNIFLTPRSDPWLGLRGADMFDALEEVDTGPSDASVADD